MVRGRGGAGSAAGAGEVDGAVGGVLCLHLRPAPDLPAVSALPVRISLRDAVRLVLGLSHVRLDGIIYTHLSF